MSLLLLKMKKIIKLVDRSSRRDKNFGLGWHFSEHEEVIKQGGSWSILKHYKGSPPTPTKMGLTYKNEKWLIETGVNIAFLDNFIYFNTLALPQQETSTFDIYSVFIKKDFVLWKIHFNNNLVYQAIENDRVLSLPEINYYGTLYIDDILFNWKWISKDFNNVLRIQLGIDVFYNSSYYGYAFMPSLEQFYLQKEKLIGDYPIISAFANIKLQNTRIFLKYENINPLYFDKNPFTALHYPLSEASFKFGLSWSFYN